MPISFFETISNLDVNYFSYFCKILIIKYENMKMKRLLFIVALICVGSILLADVVTNYQDDTLNDRYATLMGVTFSGDVSRNYLEIKKGMEYTVKAKFRCKEDATTSMKNKHGLFMIISGFRLPGPLCVINESEVKLLRNGQEYECTFTFNFTQEYPSLGYTTLRFVLYEENGDEIFAFIVPSNIR